jgi:hypothetical protein
VLAPPQRLEINRSADEMSKANDPRRVPRKRTT